jgi:uncharacterized membrane protein YeaQ/YmgE (transglycosylase-associated protein family)
MKTQRILGISWLMVFSSILALWWWQFVIQQSVHEDWHFRAYVSPMLLFGAIASFFLFRGARWARITVGILTLWIGALVFRDIWQMRYWPKFDGYVAIVALISAVILLFPRRRAVA